MVDGELIEALYWEREHAPKTLRSSRSGGGDSIEVANDTEDDEDDPMISDLPCPPDFGEALLATQELLGDTKLEEVESCSLAQGQGDKHLSHRQRVRELPDELDPHDLSQTGWGVITPRGMTKEYLDLLHPLVERRKEQAGSLFRDDLIYPGESVEKYLWEDLELSPGVVDPAKLPYYLLIVGGPERIPFELQYLLSINHAVGRIAFDETTESSFANYRRWAQAVVDAETQGVQRPKKISILSVDSGDRATQTLKTHLVEPIADRLETFVSDRPSRSAWKIETRQGELATKEGFARVLGGSETPSLALVAAHGLPLNLDNPHQKRVQGALCCQYEEQTPLADRYFCASDIAQTSLMGSSENRSSERQPSSLHGMIAFLFSCYGAGTPVEDNFPQQSLSEAGSDSLPPAKQLTRQPFIAALPQAMLREGALAVVAHVDRGWTLSFSWTLAYRETDAVRSLENSLKQLLDGHRLGHAMRALHRRYSAIAAHLADLLDLLRRREEVDTESLAAQWTAHHDARNFIILGDPAVYLRGKSAPDPESTSRGRGARPPQRSESSGNAFWLSPELAHSVHTAAAAESLNPTAWVEAILRERLART